MGSEHIHVWYKFVEAQIGIRGQILNGRGEYVVMLGIYHTCTALRYKPAFIVTWLDFCAEGCGFDPQLGQKVISIFFACCCNSRFLDYIELS